MSEAGRRLFLYSLMAEGGIPESLLKEPGLYRDVVMGLLAEIEAEGGAAAEPWAERMASRWTMRLPQAFQTDGSTRLLSGLALSLAELRTALPDDVPEAAAELWLNMHRPGWGSTIPLRMTPEIAESLIRPALRAERDARSKAAGPLCGRELRSDETGETRSWHGCLTLRDDGWLPAGTFPGAERLRLRLLPTVVRSINGVGYRAEPDEDGWRLRRFGGAAGATARVPPETPFALAAFADGRPKGEAVVDAGLPTPDEAPSFWRAADPNDGAKAGRLVPLAGPGRTRAPCLWLLGPGNVEPEAGAGVTLDEVETAPGGFLWRVSGKGALRLGERRYRVETESDDETPEARLFPSGQTLRGWRVDGNVPAYRGDVTIYGQVGASLLHPVGKGDLRRLAGRSLGGEIVEWVRNEEVLARLRLVRFPADARFELREEAPGRVALAAEGIKTGWRVRLGAGKTETEGEPTGGTLLLKLETPGAPPSLVQLRLSQPATGRSIELQAPWPARTGMILDPDGIRLAENRPISVGALYGWRAMVPEGVRGDLQLQLVGCRATSLPAAGEVSLASHMPLIEAMMAQGGPDAQVNLCLVVDGKESSRLEIRRYDDRAVLNGAVLRMGLAREGPAAPETVLGAQLSRMARSATLHAVDIRSLKQIGPIDTGASVDLPDLLEDTGGPWLIQSRLDDRAQRAVVWNPRMSSGTNREDRIDAYAEKWQRMVAATDDPEWDRSLQLMAAARQGGDPGALDQVQALARVPKAAISLALRVSPGELPEVLALESAVPIFWPVLPVSDFTEAGKAEHTRQRARLAPYFDEQEAEAEADSALVRKVGEIRALRPELAGHLCRALIDSGLFDRIMGIPDHQEALRPFLIPDHLAEVVQEAAKRFDRLPEGVGRLKPRNRPAELPSFNTYAQAMIDAPFVAAEMAAGLRPAPDVDERLVLINLRLVDPPYFDAALPAALDLCLTDSRG